jgi:hypothetical protein
VFFIITQSFFCTFIIIYSNSGGFIQEFHSYSFNISHFSKKHEAVIFTPNADLDLTARVKITNKDFGFFEIRMIIIFAEIGGNI